MQKASWMTDERQPYVWLDAKQASAYLRIGVNRVRGLMESGELKNIRLGTRRRTTYAWCDEYIERLTAATNNDLQRVPLTLVTSGADQTEVEARRILNAIEQRRRHAL